MRESGESGANRIFSKVNRETNEKNVNARPDFRDSESPLQPVGVRAVIWTLSRSSAVIGKARPLNLLSAWRGRVNQKEYNGQCKSEANIFFHIPSPLCSEGHLERLRESAVEKGLDVERAVRETDGRLHGHEGAIYKGGKERRG